jgi:hypothetical protein
MYTIQASPPSREERGKLVPFHVAKEKREDEQEVIVSYMAAVSTEPTTCRLTIFVDTFPYTSK